MSVPALRFKEFSKYIDSSNVFKSFLIKDIANIQVGRDLKEESFSEIQTIEHCYPVYSNTIENRGLYGFYNFEEYDGNSLTVVGRGAGLGKAFSRNSGFGAIGRLLVISPKNNEFNVHYFAEYVNFKLQIHNESGGIPQLPGSTFGMYSITLPSVDEQTKIANFLTAVDKKITHLTQKHDLLTQYKKGVMQQIFSQKLRFKDDDGGDFPEWEEFLLKNALIKNSAKNKKIEFTLVQSISNKHGFINQDELFEDRVIASKDLSNYYIIRKGAFAYNPSRIDVGSLAYKSDDLISVVSPLYVSFYTKPNLINDSFLFNWFDTEDFKNQMNRSFEGSVRNTLSYDALSKILIVLPILKEQIKITNFLTAIDDKITATQTQLQAVKQYKQGLLQQMFI